MVSTLSNYDCKSDIKRMILILEMAEFVKTFCGWKLWLKKRKVIRGKWKLKVESIPLHHLETPPKGQTSTQICPDQKNKKEV